MPCKTKLRAKITYTSIQKFGVGNIFFFNAFEKKCILITKAALV